MDSRRLSTQGFGRVYNKRLPLSSQYAVPLALYWPCPHGPRRRMRIFLCCGVSSRFRLCRAAACSSRFCPCGPFARSCLFVRTFRRPAPPSFFLVYHGGSCAMHLGTKRTGTLWIRRIRPTRCFWPASFRNQMFMIQPQAGPGICLTSGITLPELNCDCWFKMCTRVAQSLLTRAATRGSTCRSGRRSSGPSGQ